MYWIQTSSLSLSVVNIKSLVPTIISIPVIQVYYRHASFRNGNFFIPSFKWIFFYQLGFCLNSYIAIAWLNLLKSCSCDCFSQKKAFFSWHTFPIWSNRRKPDSRIIFSFLFFFSNPLLVESYKLLLVYHYEEKHFSHPTIQWPRESRCRRKYNLNRTQLSQRDGYKIIESIELCKSFCYECLFLYNTESIYPIYILTCIPIYIQFLGRSFVSSHVQFLSNTSFHLSLQLSFLDEKVHE